MDKFLETYNLLKTNQEESENLSRQISLIELEAVGAPRAGHRPVSHWATPCGLAPPSCPEFRARRIQSKAQVAHSLCGALRGPEWTWTPCSAFSDKVPKEAQRVSHTELSFAFFRACWGSHYNQMGHRQHVHSWALVIPARWWRDRWERSPLPLNTSEKPSWSEEQRKQPTVFQHIWRSETKDRVQWKIWR